MLRTAICISLLALTGCGGRVANPVSTHKAIDSQLSCTHLSAEQDANLKRMQELVGETDRKGLNNMGLFMISPLFLDLSDTQKVETEALVRRNEQIDHLRTEKDCSGS